MMYFVSIFDFYAIIISIFFPFMIVASDPFSESSILKPTRIYLPWIFNFSAILQENAFEQKVQLKDLNRIGNTAMTIEDTEQRKVPIGKGGDDHASIFHISSPAWIMDGLPHMWVTA